MSVINAIEDYESAAIKGGQLQDDRAKAMDYYLGKPFGNEIAGRSQVVSRDVSDSIEWIKPALLKVFTAGDEVVAFTPKNEEDIAGAEQESDYANYIITQKNEWFTTAYVWFTDALIQKNGYVLAYWDEKEDVEKEKYVDQTPEALTMVHNDPEVEIVESVEKDNPNEPGEKLYDFTLQKKTTYGCAKYLNLPPERTVYDTMHPEVRVMHSNFFEHWDYKTLSELKEDGYDVPDDIGDETSGIIFEKEEQSRNRYGEDFIVDNDQADKTMRKVKVREVWIRYDENEDGIAELLHCVVVGKTVLKHKNSKSGLEECDFIPVACLSPYIMPHRHIGISVAEKVMEIQEIKSALQRGFLDNVYLGINGRHAIDADKVNLDDMLTSRPGGVVRTQGPPGQSIMPLVHQSNFQPILAGVEYFDQVREGRTGSSKASQQMSADALTKAPSGVAIAQLMSASQALSELVARVFAETGVKDLYLMVHALSLKHARKAEIVRLRNEFVTVDPRQWKKRVDMTVAVGLGTGNRDAQMAHLGQIVELEIKLLPTGLSSLKTVHHALSKFTQAAGFKDATAFWEDASKKPPQPPPPDPKLVEAQQKMQIHGAAAQQKAQTDQSQAQASIQLEREKALAQSQIDRDKAAAAVQLEREKAMAQAQLEREKAGAQIALQAAQPKE